MLRILPSLFHSRSLTAQDTVNSPFFISTLQSLVLMPRRNDKKRHATKKALSGCNLQVIVVPIYAIQAYGLQGQVQLLRCDFSQAMDWSGKTCLLEAQKREPRSNSRVTDHVPGLGR